MPNRNIFLIKRKNLYSGENFSYSLARFEISLPDWGFLEGTKSRFSRGS